jgi:hypothetical protein
VHVVGELENLTVAAVVQVDAWTNETISNTLTVMNGSHSGPCGLLLPGDQPFTLILAVGDGSIHIFLVE